MAGQWVAAGGASSDTNGYVQGGFRTNPYGSYNATIDRHPFSSDSNGSLVQTLDPSPTMPSPTVNQQHMTGFQSLSTGYASWPRGALYRLI